MATADPWDSHLMYSANSFHELPLLQPAPTASGDDSKESVSAEALRAAFSESHLSQLAVEWNESFQQLYEQPIHTPADLAERSRAMQSLIDRFVTFARETAQVIVRERGLPPGRKVVPAMAGLGVAGGQKHVHGRVFFKFGALLGLTLRCCRR